MDLPVQNIVSEVDLKPSDALLPLFECVVNGIISLKQTPNLAHADKKIQIQLSRGDYPKVLGIDKLKTIKSIKVIDNGEGFTDNNLKSYQTAYTHKNKNFGCKGIGRFTVLAGFEKINISSTYQQNGKWLERELELDPINEVKIIKESESKFQERKTIVELINLYNEQIKDSTAISVNQIAEDLMHHCLIYYLCKDLPLIEIIDKDSNEAAIVNDLYASVSTEREKSFETGNIKFDCYVTKTEKSNNRKNHYVYYCANSRVVGTGKSLGRVNGIFSYPIVTNGSAYFLDVYIVSQYLNKKVYNARNGFAIPQEKESGMFSDGLLSFQEIEEKLATILEEEYDSFVKETQDRNVKEVKDYIQKAAPRYRRFLHREDILKSIPPNLSDDKKEEYLYKISYNERKRIDDKIQKIIDSSEINEQNIDAIKQELIEKTAYDSDSLSDYMIRRKAIIDIFKRFLEADVAGKYKLEEDIHNLIFPMGVTQREVDYESHNLWLLDERFATYSFIASDKPITSISQNKSRKEPDLVMIDKPPMFSNPICFAPEQAGEISTMVIFEFKRPGEVAHQKKGKENFRWEFSELIEKYFDDFMYGDNKKNYRGSQIVVRQNTPKYGYVIVDVIPERLETYNLGKGYRKTPFGTFYKIYPDLNMHIEVIRFQQLIDGVEKRHTPFFDKLFNS